MSRKILKVQNNQDERANITSCFSGLNIGIVSVKDSGFTGTLPVQNANNIGIKIWDKAEKKSVFDGTVLELWAFFHKGEETLNDHINSEVISAGGTSSLTDLSVKFPPLHGDYEIRVLTTNSFLANSKQESYITISADYSPDAVEYNWYLTDDTLDRKQDSFEFKAIMSATVLNIDSLSARDDESLYASALTQVSCSADQENWSRQTIDLTVQAMSFEEQPHNQKAQNLILHDNHILTNGSFEFNITDTNIFKLYMLHIEALDPMISMASESVASDNDNTVAKAIAK